MPADVADDGRQPGQRGRRDVVEVAGHGSGTGLVDVAHLEALDVREVGGRQTLGPPHGRQLLLGQHLGGAPLEQRPLLGQTGGGQKARAVAQGDGDRHEDEEERKLQPGVREEGGDERAQPQQRVQDRRVQVLVESRAGQYERLVRRVVVGDVPLDAPAGAQEAAAGAGPHVGCHPAGHGHRDEDRLLDDHGQTLTPPGGGQRRLRAREDAHRDRLLTRSLRGVGPKPRSSRSFRSMYRR